MTTTPVHRHSATATSAALAVEVFERLASHGYSTYTGVPCSLLSSLFTQIEASASIGTATYIRAVREDSAVGVATGLRLAGRPTVVLMQNSGLGCCLNVLTSLTLLYEVPLLLIISWRGHDASDAVEHTIIGRTLPALLDTIGVPIVRFDGASGAKSVDAAVQAAHDSRKPCALLVADQL